MRDRHSAPVAADSVVRASSPTSSRRRAEGKDNKGDSNEDIERELHSAVLEDSMLPAGSSSSSSKQDERCYPYHIEYDPASSSGGEASPRVVIHYQVPTA